MSLIINQILPFISLLEIDRVIDILWYFLLLLDAIVYSVVVYVYNIFQIVAQLNFSVISSWTQPLVNRVEALIMVLILFKLGMSFIQYMITPEKFNDKATGGSALLINIVICSVLLVSYQFIFTVFNELSMLIIGYQDGYEFTVLKQIANVESENGGDEAGLLGRFIFGEKFESENFGKQLAAITLFSFFDDKVEYNGNGRSDDALAKIYKQSSDEVNFFEITNMADAIYRDSNDDEIEDHGSTEYRFPLLSTAVGIYLVYTLTVLTIEVAIRIFKLIILQITAPIAIITTIEGGTKSKTFQSFYKTYISVYTSLFLRVAVVYLVSALVSMFTQNFDTLNIGTRNSIMGGFVFIIIIVSLFTFAKKIPSFIDKALGLNSSGDGEGAAGFKGLMKSMGAAVGLGVGALGGMAAGAAVGGVGGAVSGLFGGGFRGATGGYRANNVADFFRNQGAGISTTRDNALRARAQGNIFSRAGAGVENLLGIPQRQAQQAQELAHDNELIDNVLNAQANEIKDQVGNYGIKYGDNADSYADAVAQQDTDYLRAQQYCDDLMLQRQKAIQDGQDWDNIETTTLDGTRIKNSEVLTQAKTDAKTYLKIAKEDAERDWNSKAEAAGGTEVTAAKENLRREGKGTSTKNVSGSSSRDDLKAAQKANESERQQILNSGASRRANRRGSSN